MCSEINVDEYWCWNKECPDYGLKGRGNIRLKERKGPNHRALMLCRSCGHCFSETHGTPFFGLKTPMEEVIRTLALIPERGSIRAAARYTGHKPNTIIDWIDVAGQHTREVNDMFLAEMELTQVQVDEIWTFIKKRRKTYSRARRT